MKLSIVMLTLAVGLLWLLPQPYASGGPPTPDVNVVNVPGVEIVNDTPIAVTPSVKERFREHGEGPFTDEMLTVPEGKRAVVEYVDVTHTQAGDNLRAPCSMRAVSMPGYVFAAEVQLVTFGQSDAEAFFRRYTASTPVTFFAEAGEIISVNCAGVGSVRANIVGHYEDVE